MMALEVLSILMLVVTMISVSMSCLYTSFSFVDLKGDIDV